MSRFAETRDAAAAAHKERCRAYGGAVHEDEAEDRKLIKSMIGKTKLKAAHGGKVEGHKGRHRLDRRAVGGEAGGKEKAAAKKGVTVNIILPQTGPAGPGAVPRPVPVPAPAMRPPVGAGMPAGMPPPQAGLGPPGPMPGGAMPPPGMGPPRPGFPPPGGAAPPMMRARGGKIGARVHGVKMDAGAQSGEGRLEKIRMVE